MVIPGKITGALHGMRVALLGDMAHVTEVDGTGVELADLPLDEQNELLIDLPREESRVMEAILEPVTIRSKELMTEAGGIINEVHFPQTGVISLVTVLADGGGIEALTVGKDGVAGLPIIHGITTTFNRVIGQIPGVSKRVPVRTFLDALPGLPILHRRLLRYSQLAMELASQSAACNRLHITEERCARWLLLSQDRVGRDEFELTQAFLSQLLGVRRPGVTVAIGVLQCAGLIAHQRGRIRIVDRKGLEAACCECYELARRRQQELFPRGE